MRNLIKIAIIWAFLSTFSSSAQHNKIVRIKTDTVNYQKIDSIYTRTKETTVTLFNRLWKHVPDKTIITVPIRDKNGTVRTKRITLSKPRQNKKRRL